jgi:hypothetical protein
MPVEQRVTRGGAAPTEPNNVSEVGADRAAGPASAEPLAGKHSPANLANLDWDALVEYARQNFVAIYSVLSKCGYEIDGDKLIIYTVNNFYKKKLDDAKYRTSIAKTLEELGVGSPEIETIGTPPPPKDSTAAAVAAIMGGGEEVSVDT